MPPRFYKARVIIIAAVFISSSLSPGILMGADKLADLRQKVEERTKQIQEIQREIDAYKKEIDKSLKESQSLK
ncbi:MAG TPA: hypothetical protein VJJ73_02220, partial [Candidatus Paceibacterota bacterium]